MRCSKYHIQTLIEKSNAMHQIFYWSDLSIQGQLCKIIWSSKSLAQVWICSKECSAMVESQVEENQNMAKLKQFKAQVVEIYLYSILSIGSPYYQEGCNID